MSNYPDGVTGEMIEAIHGPATVSTPACPICGHEIDGYWDGEDFVTSPHQLPFDSESYEHTACVQAQIAAKLSRMDRLSLARVYRAAKTIQQELDRSTTARIEQRFHMLSLEALVSECDDLVDEIDGGLQDEPAWVDEALSADFKKPHPFSLTQQPQTSLEVTHA